MPRLEFSHVHTDASRVEGIEAGDPKIFSTATGRVNAFGHMVSLEVLDLKFESMV